MTPEHSSRATAMEGAGTYNRNSSWQSALVGTALDLLSASARQAPLGDAGAPLVIADYGSSQGRNSLAPMSAAIHALRERVGAERPICVVHNDLLGNDFASLFEVLETDPASYLRDQPRVFPSAVGRSFYGPVLPPGSVTLGWCSNSVHWLSRVPAASPDAWSWKNSESPNVRAAFQRQSDDDWRSFLTHRAQELRPGGRLVATLIASSTEDGGWNDTDAKQFHAAIRDKLVQDGVIRADEAARMVMPITYRSRTELTGPFVQNGIFANLVIEHLDISLGPDPIWDEFQRTKDVELFGKRWSTVLRVTLGPSLASALEAQRRPRFLDSFEAECAKGFKATPAPVRPWYAKMVLAKLHA